MEPDWEITQANEDDYDLDVNEARLEYIKRMEAQGFKAIFPKPNELFIDIDEKVQYDTFNIQIKRLQRNLQDPVPFSMHISRNGLPGRHIIVRLPFEINNHAERIAYQASLGSDPIRELLSLLRIQRGDQIPIMFIEDKDYCHE